MNAVKTETFVEDPPGREMIVSAVIRRGVVVVRVKDLRAGHEVIICLDDADRRRLIDCLS